MDALSDVLRVVGLTGGVFLDAEFTHPWAVSGKVDPKFCRPFMTEPAQVSCHHYMLEGGSNSAWRPAQGGEWALPVEASVAKSPERRSPAFESAL